MLELIDLIMFLLMLLLLDCGVWLIGIASLWIL